MEIKSSASLNKGEEVINNPIMAMLSALVNNTEVGIYVSDYYTCEILFINRRMADFSNGESIPDLIGQKCWKVANIENKERCSFCPYKNLLNENGEPTEPYAWELYIPHVDSWLKSINQVIKWNDGQLAHMVTFYDITKMKKMQEQLTNIAYMDKLLSLKNETKLEHDIHNVTNKPSLIVFDILSLQRINDAHGRHVGDSLLFAIKSWFDENKPDNSELYRIGGDEFCLTVESQDAETLNKLADTLYQRFECPWHLRYSEIDFEIYCNVAIAIIIGSFIPMDEPLLSLIERTLKTAKSKKAIVVYDEIMDRDYKERLNFELTLKKCVRNRMEGFDVHYQPIANPINGLWQGLEALCRWYTSDFGTVSPEIFIQEAERLELIGEIGSWVLEKAVSECKAWGLDKHDRFFLNINISPIQFSDEKLAEKVWAILNHYDFPRDKLCLEITESAQFTFDGHYFDTINRLRESNIKVALDDFGTGYSNFNQIKNIPADIVKIERDFVKNIENDSFQQYLFHTMLELTHTAGMKLIVEGIETKTQMDILIENGADFLQGYFFSKPLSADDIEKQLFHFN